MLPHCGLNSLFTVLFQSDVQALEMPFKVSDEILPSDSETHVMTVGTTRQGQAWRELAGGGDIECDFRGTEGAKDQQAQWAGPG